MRTGVRGFCQVVEEARHWLRVRQAVRQRGATSLRAGLRSGGSFAQGQYLTGAAILFTAPEVECLRGYLVTTYGEQVPMKEVELRRPRPDIQPLQRELYAFRGYGEVTLPAGQPEGINGVVKGAFVIADATPASDDE